MTKLSNVVRICANPNVVSGNAVTDGSNGSNPVGLALQSGNIGSISSPPVDAMVLTPVANAAAANILTISNAAMGQATTLTIPDPGVAAAVVDVSPSTAQNLTAVVTLNTAAVIAAYTTPALLLAAPGSGKTIIVSNLTMTTLSTSNTAYSSGGVPVISYGSTANGAGTAITTALTAAEVTASANAVTILLGAAGAALTAIANKGIYFSNATQVFAGGTGTNLVFAINYMIVSTGAN